MTRSTTQVGSALFVALGLAVYVGCGAPPSSEGERIGATGEALSSTACVQASAALTTPWLVDSTCSCLAYTGGPALDECRYEQGVLGCLKNNGYKLKCASLPPIPIVSVTDFGKFSAYYEDIDFNAYVPGNCAEQEAIYLCIKKLNNGVGPSGIPYVKPPVAAALLNHCAPTIDTCNDFPAHADFDPCTTKQCYQ
jgi:hypothetical protein